VILDQLHEHAGKTENGIGGQAFGIGQTANGMIGPVNVAAAIDQVNGVVGLHGISVLNLRRLTGLKPLINL
jgi:hypothetical protein